MRRIDENTYIDDTLVTCAEYQLFIDEMRKQRRYYQPDHWTFYKFAKGQAREPILGARHSDAIMFCQWLTERDGRHWKFRLPSDKELEQKSKPALNTSPLSYWILESSNLLRFDWIGRVPINARFLDHSLIVDRFISFTQGDWPFTKNDNRRVNLRKYKRLYDALNRAQSTPLDLNCTFEQGHVPFNLKALDRDYGLARDIESRLIWDLQSEFKFFWDYNNHSDKDYDRLVDIFTLQERIAGRSPACEGIRLVKERIR